MAAQTPRRAKAARPAQQAALGAILGLSWSLVHAQSEEMATAGAASPRPAVLSAGPLEQLVVIGSRTERPLFELPFAVSVVDADTLANAGPRVNLSEALVRVPGLAVNNRGNYAQDLQIHSRGFGARAGFGVRGLRLYADGIPATAPDGQGQVSHFDLASAERVEVLRGPYSALYGSSSGGVIALYSREPEDQRLRLGVDVGSDGLRQYRLGGQTRIGEYLSVSGQYSDFESDGYRPHSEARRELGSLRLGFANARDRVVFTAGHLEQPAQDPLGLNRAQFDADPYQVTPQAEQFDTRKDIRQTQAGASWTRAYGTRGVLRETQLAVYGGQRSVVQYLAIPAATQLNSATHSGGVIDFDRDFQGVDARLRAALWGLDWTVGLNADRQDEARYGYENFIGSGAGQQLGVRGALRRDERNRMTAFDQYIQAEWAFLPRWSSSAGLRLGEVRYDSRDRYLLNGDDSDAQDYRYRNPVLGLRYQPSERLNLYVSAGRGFETPTLNELAYRPDGTAGFNDRLRGQISRQLEVGAKWRSATASAELALFRAESDDELVVVTNAGGRSSFGNAGRARRQGAELALGWVPTQHWRTQLALTWLDARYRDAFETCGGVPCTVPDVTVEAGNRIPATARSSAFGEVIWTPHPDWSFGVEGRAQSDMAVNDRNQDFAAGYAVFALRGGYAWTHAGGRVQVTTRVDNLLDDVYAGSVIVNEGNGRYFEAGAPRTLWLGLSYEPRWQ